MTGGSDAPVRGGGAGRFRASVVVVVVLVGVLFGLGASVAVVAGIARGARSVGEQLTAAKVAPVDPHTVTESMEILTSSSFGPRYTHPSWTVRRGETVTLRITSYDDGSAPLTGAQMMFDRVQGTLSGTETVDGKSVTWVPNGEVSHTFTVVGLGLNLPIPVAPTGRSVTVVARFVVRRPGTFVWQCYAPCGSGPNSMGGAMATKGWMEGTVGVLS
ncbi:MAG: hypothetical protein M0Z42_06495 [Actinomycetota bacterium]|jgi:FtsP/CotA-like multicopper oxidase with cupredoxin domain|nr:hypothetical protein [Actinomycetota bacterium]